MTPRRLFDVRALGTVVHETRRDGRADVAVIIPLFNYEATIEECLRSVVAQTLSACSVLVIDDASTDDGCARAIDLLKRHASRFVSARVIRQRRNQGLSMARNAGIAWSDEPFLFMLDADNRLRSPALSRLLDAIVCSGAAFAYSQLRMFGDENGLGVADLWDPKRLRQGNYIDAMAMIRRDALDAADGYAVLADDHGWEDYDLWCSFAELGLNGVFLPEALCDYRVHAASMLRSRTNQNFDALMAEMAMRHPALFSPDATDPDEPSG